MNAPDTLHLDAAQLCQSQALAIADIHPSPTNPRKTFPEAEQTELIASVSRHGVMSPILVRPWPAAYAFEGERPKYELIAGERRYRAAKSAGLRFIPGTVRDLDDHETLELQIVENLHRKDLNELEEAEGYELMTKQYGYTAEQLAEKIDKSKAYIYARLKLTALCPKARDAFRDGTLDASRALLIARIPTAALQAKALEEITEGWQGPMNYRNAAKHVQDKYMLKLAEAPFPRGDAELVPAAGKCFPCPKRTGSNPELYPDVKSADICTDPECFAAKKTAHFARVKTEAKAQGKVVIEGNAAEKLLRFGDHDIKGYHKLDAKCYDADFRQEGGYPTYRELLADKGVPVTLIQKSDGALIEAVEEAAFKAVAAEAGVKTKERSQNTDKERAAKEKAENEFRRRMFNQVRSAYAEAFTETTTSLDQEDIRLVASQFLSCLWHEHQKRLAALWVPSEEKIDAHERIRTMTAMLDTMTHGELNRFLVDLALIGMSQVGSYGQTETPAPFLATAQRMLISPDTIRREIKAEQEAKANNKGKKPVKAVAPTFAVGDYVEVIAYPCNSVLVGSIGRIKTESRSIANGKAIFTLTLADGLELVTEAHELTASTEQAFEAQRDERNPAIEEEPAVVRSNRPAIAYTHPENHDLTWSGRGRKPKWIEAWLATEGNTLAMLTTNTPAAEKTAKAAACDITPRCEKTLELPGLPAPIPQPSNPLEQRP